jgi:uncharacterized protein YyaL (SSP411 family)
MRIKLTGWWFPMSGQPAPNRLINETSPYLLQHAYNPVDWWPWCNDAFARAKAEDKPVLLSCGYSACHWCHVMEHESFEDPEIADLMNRCYINIKVDREERPDIDQLYQQAVQTMTGQGGWPLTVFLDQERQPFFGGAYFPAVRAYGRLSFPDVLQAIHEKWQSDRDKIYQAGLELAKYLNSTINSAGERISGAMPDPDLPVRAILELSGMLDHRNGGFNGAPKFPNPNLLQLLLRVGSCHGRSAETEPALFTLRQMARGGIYDQVGGGFHRYSTDQQWLAPHFEKMLCDNAQLLKIYAMAYQLTGDEEFKNVVQGTADYIRREMTAPEGGFYATQDADSEGEEGKYYVWDTREIRELLEPDLAELVIEYYRMTNAGNFTGKNILNRIGSFTVESDSYFSTPEIRKKINQARFRLLNAREKRVKPFRDEKILTGWNGLMIGSLAYAYQVTSNPLDYRSAKRAAEFLLNLARVVSGNLTRIYKDRKVKTPAFLDDYAFLASGLIDLYETDFNEYWLEESLKLTQKACRLFSDQDGRYYLTGGDREDLITRPLSGIDQAIPSGVAVHGENLLRLAAFSGEAGLKDEAERILKAYSQEMTGNYWGYASLIGVLDIYYRHFKEFAFITEGAALPEMLTRLRKCFIPYRIVARKNNRDAKPIDNHPARALLAERDTVNNLPTCYVCSDFSCLPPVTDWEDLSAILARFRGGLVAESVR